MKGLFLYLLLYLGSQLCNVRNILSVLVPGAKNCSLKACCPGISCFITIISMYRNMHQSISHNTICQRGSISNRWHMWFISCTITILCLFHWCSEILIYVEYTFMCKFQQLNFISLPHIKFHYTLNKNLMK